MQIYGRLTFCYPLVTPFLRVSAQVVEVNLQLVLIISENYCLERSMSL